MIPPSCRRHEYQYLLQASANGPLAVLALSIMLSSFWLCIGCGAGERHCRQAKRDDEVAPPVALRRSYCADCN